MPHAAAAPTRPARPPRTRTASFQAPARQDIVYVADLGIDRLVAYRFRPRWRTDPCNPAKSFALPPGLGPRHLVFSSRRSVAIYHRQRTHPHRPPSRASILATGALSRSATPSPFPRANGGIVQPAGILLSA
jgi:6-phosphogluconolactonase